MSKIGDYATKGAIIAGGIGAVAGALLSLVTLAPGFLIAGLTVGLVINCFLGAAIGAGIGILARNENDRKEECKPTKTKHHEKHKAVQEECPCPEQDKASTHFQDKVYDERMEEVVQR